MTLLKSFKYMKMFRVTFFLGSADANENDEF